MIDLFSLIILVGLSSLIIREVLFKKPVYEIVKHEFGNGELITDLPPTYYGYDQHKGYANLTQCRRCLRRGLYEDQHTNNPCRSCGGKIISGGVGKWDYKNKKWTLK